MTDAIFFDLGWTLEDESQAQWQRAFESAAHCRRWGFDFDAASLLDCQLRAGTRGDAAVYVSALAELGLSAAQIAELRQVVSWRTEGLRLYDGVKAAIAALSTSYSLGIIANQSRPIHSRLGRYGIVGYFRWLLCSCELGCGKPDPAIFCMAGVRCGCDPTHIWMVGDRIDNDIVPARKLGWKTVRILQGDHAGYRGFGAEEKPDFEVCRIDQLIRIFD